MLLRIRIIAMTRRVAGLLNVQCFVVFFGLQSFRLGSSIVEPLHRMVHRLIFALKPIESDLCSCSHRIARL
jgi:hypothetical protein